MKLFLQHYFISGFMVAVLSAQQWFVPLPYLDNDDSKDTIVVLPNEQYYSDITDTNSDESSSEEWQDNEARFNSRDISNYLNRNRRREVTCEVVRNKERFEEDGYEFIPSYYVNTTCVERFACEPYFNDNSGSEQFCVVRNAECRTNFKEMTVFKRKLRHKSWHIHKIQKVAVGCCDHH